MTRKQLHRDMTFAQWFKEYDFNKEYSTSGPKLIGYAAHIEGKQKQTILAQSHPKYMSLVNKAIAIKQKAPLYAQHETYRAAIKKIKTLVV